LSLARLTVITSAGVSGAGVLVADGRLGDGDTDGETPGEALAARAGRGRTVVAGSWSSGPVGAVLTAESGAGLSGVAGAAVIAESGVGLSGLRGAAVAAESGVGLSARTGRRFIPVPVAGVHPLSASTSPPTTRTSVAVTRLHSIGMADTDHRVLG
jgi:hypothetical protein